MTLENVKNQISDHIGKTVKIKYNLGRNKFESYDVTIKEIYDYVFLVKLNNKRNPELKSFTYSDVITKTIKIDY